MSISFENYLKQVRLEELFKKLEATTHKTLAETVKHFTVKEGARRDKIVSHYFGARGIDKLTSAITESLLAPPKLSTNAKFLDVGAGSGFFTTRVAERVRSKLPDAHFYAMDLTPAMLKSLDRKKAKITPFIGLAENIESSIVQARIFLNIPKKFDAVFSTLMLHHSAKPERVFENISRVLKRNGKAVVVDMCQHDFKEFKTEMGDLHLGFKPKNISKMAQKYFSTVRVRKISGICCKSSGRSAEIFVATMQNRWVNMIK